MEFQSTRPVRGATLIAVNRAPHVAISIHAPRAGRDASSRSSMIAPSEFQSTRPVRGATKDQIAARMRKPFQSTRPVRGATRRGHSCGS